MMFFFNSRQDTLQKKNLSGKNCCSHTREQNNLKKNLSCKEKFAVFSTSNKKLYLEKHFQGKKVSVSCVDEAPLYQ